MEKQVKRPTKEVHRRSVTFSDTIERALIELRRCMLTYVRALPVCCVASPAANALFSSRSNGSDKRQPVFNNLLALIMRHAAFLVEAIASDCVAQQFRFHSSTTSFSFSLCFVYSTTQSTHLR